MGKKMFFLLFFSIYCLLGCSSKLKSDINFIAINSNYWDHEYTTVVANTDTAIEDAIKYNKIYKNRVLADEFITSKITISKDALNYLNSYIEENCISEYPKVEEAKPVYTIQVNTTSGTTKCYYYEKDSVRTLTYFNDMHKWIDKSQYKAEYKDLYRVLNHIIAQIKQNY